MSIKMFDCGFGDSFLLAYNSKCNHLLVDFGVHSNSKTRRKAPAYENVVRTVDSIKKKDFMLTHFHADHFSGMIYWQRWWGSTYRNHYFGSVIVPGINSLAVIKCLLLLSLRCCHGEMRFIEFLEWYCRWGFRGLELVARGDEYNDLKILWPDRNLLEEKATRFLEQINGDDLFGGKLNLLMDYAEGILKLLNDLRREDFNEYEKAKEVLYKVKKARKEAEELLTTAERMAYRKRVQQSDFGNDCSIVFQYKELDGQNIERCCLFTGDVTQDAWAIMEAPICPLMYDQYNVIKLPHHGTESHFHDFTRRIHDDCKFLIPNGSIGRWPTSNNYRIDMVPVIAAYDNTSVNVWARPGDTIINRDDSVQI